MLEQTITRLQDRVRELERSPPTHAAESSPEPPSSAITDVSSEMGFPSSPASSSGLVSMPFANASLPVVDASTPTPDPNQRTLWWELEHPPDDIANML